MVIKEFTAGKSAQIFIPGVGEQWIKLNPVVTVEDGETFEEACDAAFKKIDDQLKKHIPEQKKEPTEFERLVAKKETIEDLKKEFNVTTK